MDNPTIKMLYDEICKINDTNIKHIEYCYEHINIEYNAKNYNKKLYDLLIKYGNYMHLRCRRYVQLDDYFQDSIYIGKYLTSKNHKYYFAIITPEEL